jgi:UDPglucose--hexose-1-phosphate uridylyltransferase
LDKNENISKEEYKPKFMEWGIINKENFTSIKEIPTKRWDPLSTIILSPEEFGLHRKNKRFYGRYSYLSPIRAKRPRGFGKDDQIDLFLKDGAECKCDEIKDVFKAIMEGKPLYNDDGSLVGDGQTIIITQDEEKRDNPFSNKPHRISKLPSSCKAVTLINRYPSMARIIDPDLSISIEKQLPENSKLSIGINLVTVSREFYPSLCFDLIPEEVLTGIFLSMKEAILYCILEAIEKDYYDIPVSPFFNIGSKVGGSQPRIHSQTYIDLNGDGNGMRLEGYLRAFENMGNRCHLCETSHDNSNRVVLATDFWTFYATGSPIRNYHLRFHPNEHIRRFSQLKVNQISDLSKSLIIIFKALDKLEIEKNRNILFNCCPFGYDADFHLFGDIIPHEIIGGAEMAEEMRVARKLPEEAAEELRKAILE